VRAPKHYNDLIEQTPIKHEDLVDLSGEYDFIHIFNDTEDALSGVLPKCIEHLVDRGMIWASWPKKSSKLWIDLTEDGIRAAALPIGLVDVKVCAVDKDWSGLKLMRRKK